MTVQADPHSPPTDKVLPPSRSRSFLAIGAILWVTCFAALAVVYQSQQKSSSAVSKVDSDDADADDGRNLKQLKLVPQKDGGVIAQLVTNPEDADPWDADGIADFSFTDCFGNPVTRQDLLGKPFVIGFIFTNCRGPCPNVTMQMRELQERLKGLDFRLVTLTVDPNRDTAEVLREYGTHQGADFDRWKFLTGDQFQIYMLIQNSFKMPVEVAKGVDRLPGFEIIHSRNLMLVDETSRVVGKFDCQSDVDMARLRKEVKRLAKPRADAETNERKGEER